MKQILMTIFLLSSMTMLAQKNDTTVVNEFIDQWHQDASNVDRQAYFDKIDEHGIYIGTDATEIWSKQEFYDWAEPQFTGKGTAWSFKAIERNIYFGENAKYAWFDELLSFGNGGILRGSGVLQYQDGNWTIMHYVLSLPVPNEKFRDVMQVLKNKEQGNKE